MRSFEEKLELIQSLTQEQIDAALFKMDEATKAEFLDMIAIARARVDRKASLEYFMRNSKNGQRIKLTEIQKLIVDFIDEVWALALIPIVNAPMGSTKTTTSCAILADEIGRDQNIRTQVVCNAEDGAMERVAHIGKMLLSTDFRKIYPSIEKDRRKPWNASKINVKRTVILEEQDDPNDYEGEEPSSINATCRAYGINGNILGSRVERTVMDDLPNADNAISELEGNRVSDKIDHTVLSRKESPIGETEAKEDPSRIPFRALFINTPWTENDCVMRRVRLPNYVTILIGVNQDFTGYNVEIWNLPDTACKRLHNKYKMCKCGHCHYEHISRICTHINKETEEKCKCRKFSEIPGYNVYHQFPAKMLFTIPLSRPDWWYKNEAKGNPRKFDQMYRCIVYSDQEKAYPQFDNCLDFSRKHRCVWQEITTIRKGKPEITGNRGYIANPPNGAGLYAAVDLAGMNREGTVITIGWLLGNYKRFPIDIWIGAWSGDEISDLLTQINQLHPELQMIFVEDQAQQQLWIKEVTKHKEQYPWWFKIKEFKTNVKSKNDKLLGVLAMDTAFANRGIEIVASFDQEGHPPIGDPVYPNGCPCGFCHLIRDARNQLRLNKVSADTLMSFWMFHSSLPQVIEMPEGEAPDGFPSAQTGLEFADALTNAHDESLTRLDRVLYPEFVEEDRYCGCAHKYLEHEFSPNGATLCSGIDPDTNINCACKEYKQEDKFMPEQTENTDSTGYDTTSRLPKGWLRIGDPGYGGSF